ncbi:hypothetical protein B4U79_16168 [Dinothrombium tinctorium]|uniref:C2H2-type domain-containing protein n=1 Tax=Dinothrombium tinctorium TaxID=1965070 RepID=A0A3S3PRU1_9ACAR|nr:hypothetical protein B4U79_16168 [Dinothrombium tinctorium]
MGSFLSSFRAKPEDAANEKCARNDSQSSNEANSVESPNDNGAFENRDEGRDELDNSLNEAEYETNEPASVESLDAQNDCSHSICGETKDHCSVSSTIVVPTNSLSYEEVVESCNHLYSPSQAISSSLEATCGTLDHSDINITADIEEEIIREEQEDNGELLKLNNETNDGNISHEKIGDYYFCTFPHCRSKFKRLNHFERHLNTVHEQVANSLNYIDTSLQARKLETAKEPLICSYPNCNKTYKSRKSFQKHITSHERATPLMIDEEYELNFDGGRKRNLSQTDQSSESSRSESVASKSDRSSLCDSTTYQNGKSMTPPLKKKRKQVT